MTTQTISFEYAESARLLLPQANTCALALVGCGGTGSWLAPAVVRVARLLSEKFGKDVHVHFYDPDVVEPKNCYRQNFCEAEIGHNKAETLAWRYGAAWGVDVCAHPEKFEQRAAGKLEGLRILIGCVDRAAARRELRKAAEGYNGWWLDCGNHKSAGQVVLGSGRDCPKDPFELQGFCSWLSLPSVLHPELLEDEVAEGEAGPQPGELSCADLAMQDSQGLAINQRIAAEAADYLVRMLLTGDLRRRATYLDLASGSSRSIYITDDRKAKL